MRSNSFNEKLKNESIIFFGENIRAGEKFGPVKILLRLVSILKKIRILLWKNLRIELLT